MEVLYPVAGIVRGVMGVTYDQSIECRFILWKTSTLEGYLDLQQTLCEKESFFCVNSL